MRRLRSNGCFLESGCEIMVSLGFGFEAGCCDFVKFSLQGSRSYKGSIRVPLQGSIRDL